MNLARSDWTPLFALDRLNSWVRVRHQMCSTDEYACDLLRRVIYWTKTQAILATSKRYQIAMRRVMVPKPCRRCDGTGSWLSWRHQDFSGEDMTWEEFRANYGERCFICRGTGTAKLRFIETTLGPLRWHTPAERWYMSSLDVYVPFRSYYEDEKLADEAYETETNGWQPDTPGRPLPLPDARRDMHILLDAFPHEVCFSLDFHYRTELERRFRCYDLQRAHTVVNYIFDKGQPPIPNYEPR